MQGEEKNNTWNTLRSRLLIVLRKGVMGHGSQASWLGSERERADPSSILVTGGEKVTRGEKDNWEGC